MSEALRPAVEDMSTKKHSLPVFTPRSLFYTFAGRGLRYFKKKKSPRQRSAAAVAINQRQKD